MRSARIVLALVALLSITCILALLFGTESTSVARALSDPGSLDRVILVRARLPRVALAAIAGGGLSAVGAPPPTFLRHPPSPPQPLRVFGRAPPRATFALPARVARPSP